jgi:hypothetical protein
MSAQGAAACPACGSGRTVEILYEYPISDPRLQEDLRARRAVLAGRPRTGNDPCRRCHKCGYEWDSGKGVRA